MKKLKDKVILFMLFICFVLLVTTYEEDTSKPLILDMDYSTDVDDVCALRVAINLHKMGIIKLKAIGLCTTAENEMNLKAVDGLLDYDNLKRIPLAYSHQIIPDNSPYWETLAEYSNFYLSFDAVSLYRFILTYSQEPVTILTTGYLNNIADLVKSGPDWISTMSGKELLEANKTKIYITGGEPDGWSNNLSFYPEAREATEYLINNVEGLYFIQSDTGGAFITGDTLQYDPLYENDPVTKALFAFNNEIYGRFAWDPTAVWIAAYQNYDYCNMNIEPINVKYDKFTGYDKFIITKYGKHYRIYRSHDNINFYKSVIDNLILPINIH